MSNIEQLKLLIKQRKYRLANETKVNDDFLNILVKHNILTNGDTKNIEQIKSTTGNEAAAYEIYKLLENTTDDNAFQDVVDLIKTQGNTKLIGLLADDASPPRKSKSHKGKSLLLRRNRDLGEERNVIEPPARVDVTPKQVTNSNIFYHFHPSHKIGSGEGSMVFGGYVKIGPREIPAAVKIVDTSDTRLMNSELEVCGRLKEEDSSPTINIASLLEWKEDGSQIYFATKLAERNFHKEITEHVNPFRDKRKIIGYLKNVGEALQWLHDQKILHRHIKPQNVLIYKYRNETVAKLGEFGVSRAISKSEGSRSAGRGTEEWMSPEQLDASDNQKTFINTKMVDIFAFGMLCYFGLTGGEHPIMDKKGGFRKHILDPDKKPRGLDCRHLLAQEHLLFWMMQKNEKLRPTIKQILQHPFFWTEKESMSFIKAVAAGFSMKRDSPWEVIRGKIDTTFKDYYTYIHNGQEFNWFVLTDEKLRKRKSETREKKYKSESFISFVELVRDKDEHKVDMLDDLYKTFVDDDDGAFSEEKYFSYFIKILPEMIIVLFCALATIAPQHKQCMDTLTKQYLTEFVNCQESWSDPTVSKFLEFYYSDTSSDTNEL